MNSDSPSLIRQLSRRVVAEVLLRDGPVSRAALARATGLSKQTMSQVIAELEQGGLVQAAGLSQGPMGRSATSFEIVKRASYALGVDSDGSKTSAAVADLAGDIVAETTQPTDPRGGVRVIEQIRAMAEGLADGLGIGVGGIRSIVVGMPGVVDPGSGAITLVPNIKGLSDFNVARALGEHFGQTVGIENDVNLAMLGEVWRGCAAGCQNAAFIALGTGVGLGFICNGKLVRGASGAAGEIAYLPIGDDTTSSNALEVGAFELEVGSIGMVRRYRATGGRGVETVPDVFARLGAGDRIAASVLDSAAHTIALAITAVQAITDPELVVLGGTVGVRPELVERVQRAMPRVYARPVRIAASALGSRAGLVGAVSMAVHRLHNDLFGIPGMPGELVLPSAPLTRAAE